MPHTHRAEVRKLVDEMLQQDFIQHSSSPWASPIVLVEKKDGSTRFCVDYRRLNEVTRKDAYPLPRIDMTLDTLAGFSTLDLLSVDYRRLNEVTRKDAYPLPRIDMHLRDPTGSRHWTC